MSKSPQIGPVERLARHDQRIVAFSVALIVLLAGAYTFLGVGMTMTAPEMTRMARPIGNPMEMATRPVGTAQYVLLVFGMWWIMMIAMMTPSAAPVLLLFTALKRMGSEREKAVLFSWLFLCGYLLAWATFSALATGFQFAADQWGVTSGSMMTVKSRTLSALIFLGAGVYQLSAVKQSCLRHCQSPAQFLARHRRPGASGALIMGARHGAYCLGCCWALMALLFVGGIMNLYWIVGIAVYVFVEKVVKIGPILVRSTGVGLILFGAYLLAI